MNSRYFANANIHTLADVLRVENLSILGKKIHKISKDVIYNDSTINPDLMKPNDRKIYDRLSNPNNWIDEIKGNKTSTVFANEKRFKEIVNKYGTLQLQPTITAMIASKWSELLTATADEIQQVNHYLQHMEFCGNTYLKYIPITYKTPEQRKCISCGRDISNQHPKSKFCTAKFVGEQQAHKCRNMNSNPRNNFNRQLENIYSKGQTLFDITPYLKKVS